MKAVLITGGAGAFGSAFAKDLMLDPSIERIAIYSRGEHDQVRLSQEIPDPDNRLRWFIGDVRDRDRLSLALRGIDTIVHAAALKVVPVAEYNPTEAIKTNIMGAVNVVDAALRSRTVEHVVALSTDKACAPVNLYGATKLAAEKTILAGNDYGGRSVRFNVTRYGNVSGSTGSVIPYWRMLLELGAESLPITHPDMTRFWMTMHQAVGLVDDVLHEEDLRGKVVVPKLASYRVTDLAEAVMGEFGRTVPTTVVGIRPGEKIHESLISEDEAVWATDHDWAYYIDQRWPMRVVSAYSSERTDEAYLTPSMLRTLLKEVL
jgi:UDP-N-acetylglucosamine 4,6-dehydratase